MKIKKSRLLSIIQEEIARMDEVEVLRRGSKKDKELALWDQWNTFKDSKDSEDRKKAEEAFKDLYEPIKDGIIKFLQTKNIRTSDRAGIEDIAQDVFLKIINNPALYGGRAALSSFLKGNSLNLALSQFKRITKHGGRPTSTDPTPDQYDTLQQDDDILDVMGGSRFPSPEKQAIARDLLRKVAEKIEDKELKNYFILRFIDELSQTAASAELGFSQSTASRYEGRIRDIINNLNKINVLNKDDNVNEGKEEGGISLEETIKNTILEMYDDSSDLPPGLVPADDDLRDSIRADVDKMHPGLKDWNQDVYEGLVDFITSNYEAEDADLRKDGYLPPKGPEFDYVGYEDPGSLGKLGDLKEAIKEALKDLI